MLAGVFLKSKIPSGILNILSFFIFAIFGVLSIREAMGLIFGGGSSAALVGCIVITAVFAVICALSFFISENIKGEHNNDIQM